MPVIMNGNASDNERENGKLPDGGRNVSPFYYLTAVILPAAVGVAAVIFGCLKEPETVRHWSRLVMLVNRYPFLAVLFGVFLLIQPLKAFMRARR